MNTTSNNKNTRLIPAHLAEHPTRSDFLAPAPHTDDTLAKVDRKKMSPARKAIFGALAVATLVRLAPAVSEAIDANASPKGQLPAGTTFKTVEGTDVNAGEGAWTLANSQNQNANLQPAINFIAKQPAFENGELDPGETAKVPVLPNDK